MDKLINKYAQVCYYEQGQLDAMWDGFEPINDEFHITYVYNYGNGLKIEEVFNNEN